MIQFPLRMPLPPVAVDLGEIEAQTSGHGVIALCANKAGKLDKVVAADLSIQEAVWSRIKSGQNSLSLEQLDALMTACGNESPLHWLLLRRNYDPRSLRKLESETERELRETREALESERLKVRVLSQALRGEVTA